MCKIITFNFNNLEVRTFIKNNENYFCLSDCCKILNLSRFRTERLDKDGWIQNHTIDNLGREQEANFINEPNLYRVIFRSDKPEAVKFQDWVFNEVLPTLRKN
jgi:anti-repressor protein